MKTKTRDKRFLLSVVLSLLVAMATIFVAGEASFFACELGVETGNSSEEITTTVWGAPFRFVIDMPSSESIGAINGGDKTSGSAFLADWLAWFLAAWLLSYTIPVFFRFLFHFARDLTRPNE